MGNLRCILKFYRTHIYNCARTIMTTQNNLEKALEKLQKNPYFDKYADRISELQKTSPEEFMQRVEQQNKTIKKESKNKFASLDTRQFSSVLNPKEVVQEAAAAEDDKLDAIFKTDLVKDKNAEEIQAIWEEYHKNKEVISAIIPLAVYTTIQEHMKAFATFLFPLPRSHGYEFIMCQNLGHSVHFTPLLAYQVHKENAPECLKVAHYTELADKGLVLMRGDYDKNVLNGEEARCLANQFQMYYSGRDANKLGLLETFSNAPATFKHTDLIRELENIPVA